ncbi:mitochondrial distribution and morphology protein 10 [Flagelloscypha sp. PMI_526]|nr:mitochondrial distribution and morphology protein 10 [Flagelloscypha sp. PMI_526]
MHPFASYVLRSYYKATGWNEDNLYANLTRSSNAVLDFTVPRGLSLSLSKSSNDLFRTTYSMNAMPSLNGSVGYIFTSRPLDVRSSGDARFKDMLERFRVYDEPRRPEGREEVWQGGERVDERDYLLYGRYYLPTGRLDALYSTRISATLQALVAAISDPPTAPAAEYTGRRNLSNVMLSLQHDVGKWCSEYTWSAEDEMWGFRVLHNFGRLNKEENRRTSVGVEEEEALFQLAFAFTTLPDATPPSFQLPSSSSLTSTSPLPKYPYIQTPTTITALFNPMLGHLSGAYTARVSPDLALASRFDFNVYSFESEWTVGAEWWLRRRQLDLDDVSSSPTNLVKSPVNGVVKVRASTSNDVSLMWEGRLRNMLVSFGVVSDLASRVKPIKAIGLEMSYFTSPE